MSVIRRKFQFDAAHMLSRYEGKCSNLHGHTYTGEVQIEGEVSEETGMLIDYNLIKQVIDEYDHAVLFSCESIRETAEEALYKWSIEYSRKSMVIRIGKCTAENIATQIASDLKQQTKRISGVRVWLHETPDSTAIGVA